MACNPSHPESLEALRRLRDEVQTRGDECLAVLLSGIDAFVRAGREMELLDAMRHMGAEMADAVAGTPTAVELERLYGSGPDPSPEHPDSGDSR